MLRCVDHIRRDEHIRRDVKRRIETGAGPVEQAGLDGDVVAALGEVCKNVIMQVLEHGGVVVGRDDRCAGHAQPGEQLGHGDAHQPRPGAQLHDARPAAQLLGGQAEPLRGGAHQVRDHDRRAPALQAHVGVVRPRRRCPVRQPDLDLLVARPREAELPLDRARALVLVRVRRAAKRSQYIRGVVDDLLLGVLVGVGVGQELVRARDQGRQPADGELALVGVLAEFRDVVLVRDGIARVGLLFVARGVPGVGGLGCRRAAARAGGDRVGRRQEPGLAGSEGRLSEGGGPRQGAVDVAEVVQGAGDPVEGQVVWGRAAQPRQAARGRQQGAEGPHLNCFEGRERRQRWEKGMEEDGDRGKGLTGALSGQGRSTQGAKPSRKR